MKILIPIITLVLVVTSQADEEQAIRRAYEERDAEIRKEIKLIEQQLFELTARVSALHKKLRTTKPDGVSHEDPVIDGELVIDVLGEGKYSVDANELTAKSLKRKLEFVTSTNKNLCVRIRGNGKVKFIAIANLIDLLQKLGVNDISFAIQTPRK